MKVTLKRGRMRRTVVLEHPPFPKVGDMVIVKGEGAEWTVTAIGEAEIIARIAQLSGASPPPGGRAGKGRS